MEGLMIRCIGLIAVALLIRDEKADLLAAAKKAGEAKSYAFRGETKLVLPEELAKSGGGESRFEGKVERDKGAWQKTDAFEFFTAGGKTVARAVPEWRLLKEEGEVQRLLYQSLAGSRPPRLPHEDLAGWHQAVTTVRRTDAKEAEGRIYEMEFTPEASRDLVSSLFPMGRYLERIPIDPPATGRAWIDDSGRLGKMELAVNAAVSIQGSIVKMSATRTVTLTEFDAAKVDIPAEAKKVLEAK
jgi:hypothetical protein